MAEGYWCNYESCIIIQFLFRRGMEVKELRRKINISKGSYLNMKKCCFFVNKCECEVSYFKCMLASVMTWMCGGVRTWQMPIICVGTAPCAIHILKNRKMMIMSKPLPISFFWAGVYIFRSESSFRTRTCLSVRKIACQTAKKLLKSVRNIITCILCQG